jgi:uncharacterized protein YceK
MSIYKSLSLLVAVTVAAAGCGSLAGRGDKRFYLALYPGVRYDAHYLAHREEITDMQALWWLGVFDVPLSAALDTAYLPWDLPYWASQPSSSTNSISK